MPGWRATGHKQGTLPRPDRSARHTTGTPFSWHPKGSLGRSLGSAGARTAVGEDGAAYFTSFGSRLPPAGIVQVLERLRGLLIRGVQGEHVLEGDPGARGQARHVEHAAESGVNEKVAG